MRMIRAPRRVATISVIGDDNAAITEVVVEATCAVKFGGSSNIFRSLVRADKEDGPTRRRTRSLTRLRHEPFELSGDVERDRYAEDHDDRGPHSVHDRAHGGEEV